MSETFDSSGQHWKGFATFFAIGATSAVAGCVGYALDFPIVTLICIPPVGFGVLGCAIWSYNRFFRIDRSP